VENAKKQIREVCNTSLSDSGGGRPYIDFQQVMAKFDTDWSVYQKAIFKPSAKNEHQSLKSIKLLQLWRGISLPPILSLID